MGFKKIDYTVVKMTTPLVILAFIISLFPVHDFIKISLILGSLGFFLYDKEHFILSLYYYNISNPNMKIVNSNRFFIQIQNKFHNYDRMIQNHANLTSEEKLELEKYQENKFFFDIKILKLKFFFGDTPLYNIIHCINLSENGYIRCIQNAIVEILEKEPALIEKNTGNQKNKIKSAFEKKVDHLFKMNLNNSHFQKAILSDLPEFINLKNNIIQDNPAIAVVETKAKLEAHLANIPIPESQNKPLEQKNNTENSNPLINKTNSTEHAVEPEEDEPQDTSSWKL